MGGNTAGPMEIRASSPAVSEDPAFLGDSAPDAVLWFFLSHHSMAETMS
jgi:hypothetical protein